MKVIDFKKKNFSETNKIVLTIDNLSRRAEKAFDLNSFVLRKQAEHVYAFKVTVE